MCTKQLTGLKETSASNQDNNLREQAVAMNNSSSYDYALIEIMNDEKARLLVPATVYIAVLMVSGLIGNTMVCVYYGFKAKRTTSSIFIVTLAVYDLIVCSICMPTEIVDIEKFYTFENNGACKILRFLNYFAALGSILTLIVIATDRYKKLCKPTGDQITLKKVKYITIVVGVISIALSWPSLIIYGSIRVNIPNDYNIDLKGFDCTSTKSREFRPYVWAFNILHFLLFLVCTIALIVLYSVIGRSLYLHAKNLSKHRKSTLSHGSVAVSTSVEMEEVKINENSRKPVSAKPSVQSKQASTVDTETVRLTFIMIAITILFIASFLPYLSLTIWRVYKGKHEAEFLSDAGLIGFKIGSRSFLLNSSLNPWIYGIFNRAFRNYFLAIFCCRRS